MKKIIVWFFCITTLLLATESGYKLEEIEELYQKNIITREDYEILKQEILGKDEDALYTLTISNTVVDSRFPIIFKNGYPYINLNKFIRNVGIGNYKEKDGVFEIGLGKDVIPVVIDFNNYTVSYNKEDLQTYKYEFIVQNSEYYLKDNLFKKIFLTYLTIDRKDLSIKMGLAFKTPEKIKQLLELEKQKLEREKEEEIVYRSQNKFFDIGYARFSFAQNFSKIKNNKMDKDWSGNIEYQGAMLFGELTTDYNVKKRELGSIRLAYNNIFKNHRFVIDNHRAFKNNGKRTREWGAYLYKDKGYFDFGQNVLIHEDVPIGSRVELLYLGTVIDIKDAKNGYVEFSGDLIKNDREYELKVYTPDNKILTKKIKTTQDYNRQNKSEISYNMSITQDVTKDRYNTNFNAHYGVTDRFTIGGGLTRNAISYYQRRGIFIESENKKGYADRGNINLVYGGVKNGIGYTASTTYSKTLNTDDPNVDKSQTYTWDNKLDLSYGKLRLNLNYGKNGRENSIKYNYGYSLKYDILDRISIGYNYGYYKNYDGKESDKKLIDISSNYTYNGILFTLSGNLDLKESRNNRYIFGVYYGGAQNYNLRLVNSLYNKGENYSSTLTFTNNNFLGFLDVILEGTYDSKKKGYLTFKFNMKLMDLINVAFNGDRDKNFNLSLGVDKVIDLKNPTIKIDSTNTSRLFIKTFIDENNNNIFDKGEVGVSGVEVEVGKDIVDTDKYGEAVIYNISNNIKQDVKVKIKKPHYLLENENLKVYGTTASTLDLFIPVKPMIDLSGYVNFADDLNLTPEEKVDFYNDILIEIKDKKGKTLEYVAPDNTGEFEVSGLFPEEYIIEVSYLGDKYILPNMEGKLKLMYNSEDENSFNYKVAFEVNKNEIKMYTKK